jgi:hypothetical protein
LEEALLDMEKKGALKPARVSKEIQAQRKMALNIKSFRVTNLPLFYETVCLYVCVYVRYLVPVSA